MTEQELILELVENRIKRFLMKHRCKLQSEIYIRCGRGSTPQQFFDIIKKLEKQGLVTILESERRAPVLNWIEQQP